MAKGSAIIPISCLARVRHKKAPNREGIENNIGNINPHILLLHLDRNTCKVNIEIIITTNTDMTIKNITFNFRKK